MSNQPFFAAQSDLTKVNRFRISGAFSAIDAVHSIRISASVREAQGPRKAMARLFFSSLRGMGVL
jgi:hypothetical protein